MNGLADSGFWSLLTDAGPIIIVVFAILLGMSLASWSLIILKLLQFFSTNKSVRADLAALSDTTDLKKAILRENTDIDSASQCVAREGLGELERMEGAVGSDRRQDVISNVRSSLIDETDAQLDRLYGSLAFLSTCANAAPLLGLFGTVWGIINSFSSITDASTEVAAVAPGLAEALSTTAFGLIVAIPAVLAYNYFLKSLSRIEADLTTLSRTILNRIKNGSAPDSL